MQKQKPTDGAIWQAVHTPDAGGDRLLAQLEHAKRTPRSVGQVLRVANPAP